MDFTKNMGSTDRTIRLVVGIGFIAWAFYASSWILGIIGVVLLATSAMAWCPAYLPLKMNTNKGK
ncbi:DUF2892 domain-containing protein [Thioalkalicoccus limnaeus]|uniref:DUF2892 domain-containing protein n=1 Tax=Thioalkalicoccus limnaeus TaxID=120681 RepID=A0ABV4BDT1_9GAMM